MIEPYQVLGLLGGQLLEFPSARPRVVAMRQRFRERRPPVAAEGHAPFALETELRIQ